jgi:hypothetical protein
VLPRRGSTPFNIGLGIVLDYGVVNISRMTIQIGSRFYGDGLIIAIFETKGWFMICTKTMGALVGSPKYIDGNDLWRLLNSEMLRKMVYYNPKLHLANIILTHVLQTSDFML